jgi:hypothetical protein
MFERVLGRELGRSAVYRGQDPFRNEAGTGQVRPAFDVSVHDIKAAFDPVGLMKACRVARAP